MGFSKPDVARILGRDSSLVYQFYSKGKGQSYVEALQRVVEAARTERIRDIDQLANIARPLIRPRRTKQGTRARTRQKPFVKTRQGSETARAGRQMIRSGAEAAARVILDMARQRGRIAFTVRLRTTDYLHTAGEPNDSPGVRRDVVTRRDRTEERSYGNAPIGFDAVEWRERVNAHGGDAAVAVLAWLIDTGRVREDAEIVYLEVRGWIPRD